MNGIAYFHAPLEHGSEVAWSLSILRDLRLAVDAQAATRVVGMRDNCSLILLNDLIVNGRVTGSPPSTAAVIARAEDPLAWRSDDWLLAYECARNGWSNPATFRAQPQWKELLDLNVSFYSPITKALTPTPVTPSPAPAAPVTPPPTPAPPVTTAPMPPTPVTPAPVTPAPAPPPPIAPTTSPSGPVPAVDEGGEDEEGDDPFGYGDDEIDEGQAYN